MIPKFWDNYVVNIALVFQGHTMTPNFQVMNMDQADVVLGRAWLCNPGPTLKQSYEHNLFMFEDNGTHVLLLGEKNVPPSPLICMPEIASTSHEIEEVFLCYSLCHVLSNVSFHESNDKCDDENKNAKSTLPFPTHVTQMVMSNVIPNGYVINPIMDKDNHKSLKRILSATSINKMN